MKPDLVLCGSLDAAFARSFDELGIAWDFVDFNSFLWEWTVHSGLIMGIASVTVALDARFVTPCARTVRFGHKI